MASDSIDTNIILRIIACDNIKQRRRAIALLSTPNTIHVLSDVAIAEVVFALEKMYHMTREEIGNQLLFFFARFDSDLSYNKNVIRSAVPFYLEHPKLSFADCWLACEAEDDEAEPLFTFDQKLARQHPSAKLLQ